MLIGGRKRISLFWARFARSLSFVDVANKIWEKRKQSFLSFFNNKCRSCLIDYGTSVTRQNTEGGGSAISTMLGFIKTTLKMALGRRSPSEAPKDGKMKKTDCRHQLAAQNVSRRNAGHPSPAEQLQSRNSPPPQSLSETVEGKCAECKKEKHDRRIYRWKLLGGLCLPYLLASLDLTIVATAVPFIASDFSMLQPLLSIYLPIIIIERQHPNSPICRQIQPT